MSTTRQSRIALPTRIGIQAACLHPTETAQRVDSLAAYLLDDSVGVLRRDQAYAWPGRRAASPSRVIPDIVRITNTFRLRTSVSKVEADRIDAGHRPVVALSS